MGSNFRTSPAPGSKIRRINTSALSANCLVMQEAQVSYAFHDTMDPASSIPCVSKVRSGSLPCLPSAFRVPGKQDVRTDVPKPYSFKETLAQLRRDSTAARMADLTTEDIINKIKDRIHDERLLVDLAQSIGRRDLDRKNAAAQELMVKVMPLARSMWGQTVNLVLHGSRAKLTFVDDSDFDYHIENTPHPLTLDEMYKFKKLCNRIPGVSTIPKIKMALSMSYVVADLDEGGIHVEIAPARADYIDDATTIEPLIQQASSYFKEHASASHTVKLLKFLFQRTQPRLKACAIEQLVQDMHAKVVYSGRYLAGRDCGSKALLLLCFLASFLPRLGCFSFFPRSLSSVSLTWS